jgi:HPt (histidine-containing phosphotransfer) domain-containing protein
MSNCDGESLRRLSPEAVHEIVRRIERQFADGAERIVDCRAALARLDDDVELFQDLLAFYFADSPELLAQVHASISAGNADGVHRAAHRLKASFASFDARLAVEAAERLETIGRQGTLKDAQKAAEQLDRQAQRVTGLLREFCPPGP